MWLELLLCPGLLLRLGLCREHSLKGAENKKHFNLEKEQSCFRMILSTTLFTLKFFSVNNKFIAV